MDRFNLIQRIREAHEQHLARLARPAMQPITYNTTSHVHDYPVRNGQDQHGTLHVHCVSLERACREIIIRNL